MFPFLRSLLTIALCWLLSGPASAGDLRQKLFAAKSYAGSRDRQYQVFVPSTYTGQSPVQMVMVLHGCRQTELNMINETRFKDLAMIYASGFLYGLTQGAPLATCGRLGSLAAAEVIGHIGARPEASLRKLAQERGLLGE